MTGRQSKVWFVLLLFVHLLVHPTLHDFSLSATNSQVSQNTGSSSANVDDCAFCRDASALRAMAPVLLLHWQPVVVQLVPTLASVPTASFEASAVSPRAPPAF